MSYPTNVPVLLASTTLSSAAASVTFSSIPQTYKSLQVITSAFGTGGTGAFWMSCQLNSDTGSNYSSAGFGIPATALNIAAVHGPSSYLTSANADAIAVFANYASTTRFKSHVSSIMYVDGTTAAYTLQSFVTCGVWRSTSAITSMYLFPSAGGNFGVASTFQLYGIP